MKSFIKLNQNKFVKLISILIAILTFVYPTNNNLLFDGIVFDKKFEIFFLLFFLPFLIINKLKINNLYKILIIILLFTKSILIFLPNNGILYSQFIINENSSLQVKNSDYLLKQKENLSILNRSLYKFNDFPIEWINYIHPINFEIGPNCHFKEVKCDKLIQNVDNYKFKFEIKSYVHFEKDSKFYFETNSVDNYNLILKNKDSEIKLQIDNQNNKIVNSNLPTIKKGNYILNGKIIFNGSKDLKFIPILIQSEKTADAFRKGIFFQTNLNQFQFNLIKILSLFFNISLILTILLISFKILINNFSIINIKEYFINYVVSFIFIISIFSLSKFYNFNNIFNNFFQNDSLKKIISGTFLLSFYILLQIFVTTILIYFKKIKNFNYKNINQYFLFFIILNSLIYIFILNYNNITSFILHSQGDDWWIFEYYSYRILVLKEFLEAGEKIFYFRPLSRYVSAFNHLFFGQTFFIHLIIDIWSILLSAYFLIKILSIHKLNKYIIFFTPTLLVFLYFGETFKLLIGRGMPEYLSSVILVSATYFLLKYKENIDILKLVLISFLLTIGVWLREDHIFISFVLIFLCLRFDNLTNTKNFILTIFINHKKIVFSFFIFLFIGFSLIFIRNYYLSGQFVSTNVHPNFGSSNYQSILSIYRIVSGSPFENLPRSFSIFNFVALLFSILYIFKYKISSELYTYSILILTIIIPYLFLINWGYYPRFSIHLLPFSLIYISLLYKHNKLKFKILNKFKFN